MTTARSLTKLAASLAVLLALPTAAFAEIRIVIPGNTCRPGNGDVSKISYTERGAYNDSTSSSAKVYCPIAYEDAWLTRTSTAKNVVVTVSDQNSTADVTCTLFETAYDGGVFSSVSKTSTGSSATPQQLTLSAPMSTGARTYSVVCTLPAAVGTSKCSVRSVIVKDW